MEDDDTLIEWFKSTFQGWHFWPAFVFVLPFVVMARTLQTLEENMLALFRRLFR